MILLPLLPSSGVMLHALVSERRGRVQSRFTPNSGQTREHDAVRLLRHRAPELLLELLRLQAQRRVYLPQGHVEGAWEGPVLPQFPRFPDVDDDGAELSVHDPLHLVVTHVL